MQFKNGVDVLSADNTKVGEVDRVVIDPHKGTVTNIVVRRGFFFGSDKVLSLDLIERSDDNAVRLNVSKDKLDQAPDFINTHYVALDPSERERTGYGAGGAVPMYYYPTLGPGGQIFGGGALPIPAPVADPYMVEQDVNLPEGTIPLKAGAKVIGQDGKEVGDVEKVLTENKEKRVTALVVTKGTLSKQRRIIPAGWIDAVKDDGVRLTVTSQFVERLREVKE